MKNIIPITLFIAVSFASQAHAEQGGEQKTPRSRSGGSATADTVAVIKDSNTSVAPGAENTARARLADDGIKASEDKRKVVRVVRSRTGGSAMADTTILSEAK